MRLLLGPLLRPTNLPQHVSLDLLITPPHEPTHRSIINLSDFILYTGYHWILYHSPRHTAINLDLRKTFDDRPVDRLAGSGHLIY
ncbi:hypothetical protein TWF225_009762 [Orbilia oligospora]|uniref:Uncharacterized protein n=1 Tax=Orbilia oligospora TaxID=2813651 RepID=A0A8H2HD05_ORBOL|nr:hypothetical protein TWF225_009762 [Orbilia oligospora]TGJ62324.1 hypothetical protein EYR41_002303 [Orbilia oligospora]